MKRKNNLIKLVFTVIGIIGGFLYWKFVGCTSGTCPIKSVWYLMTLWGAVMGYLIGDLVGSLVVKYGEKHDEKV